MVPTGWSKAEGGCKMAPPINIKKKRNNRKWEKNLKIIEIFKRWCLLALIRWKERSKDRWHLPARIKLEPPETIKIIKKMMPVGFGKAEKENRKMASTSLYLGSPRLSDQCFKINKLVYSGCYIKGCFWTKFLDGWIWMWALSEAFLILPQHCRSCRYKSCWSSKPDVMGARLSTASLKIWYVCCGVQFISFSKRRSRIWGTPWWRWNLWQDWVSAFFTLFNVISLSFSQWERVASLVSFFQRKLFHMKL